MPFLIKAQEFSLNFECGASSSIDAAMIGTSDSIEATITIPGDTSLIDSILVEIAVKGNPVFWGPTTITTSAGEVVVIPFPGLITNTGSNEEAALYRAWVGPAQSITATTPVVDPLHYDDWQSMTTFQVRNDFDCLSGSSSDGDILLFHACDTFFFDIDSVIAPFKDVSIIAPISELGDQDTTRTMIISVNYVHNGVVTNVCLDTFDGSDITGNFALLYEKTFSVPGTVDTIELIFISPDGVFPPFNSCAQQVPFGGDSFIIGTVVVSSACDECCSIEITCDTIPSGSACDFASVPPIPAVLLDSLVSYAGNVNLDSLAYSLFGGSYTTTFCDTVYIVGSDEISGEGCPGDTGYVFRSFVFFNAETNNPVDTCELTYVVLDSINPIISCPLDTTLQCDLDDYPPYQILTLFIAAGGSASDDCGLDEASFTLLSEVSDGLTCPETISRTYSVADSCGNIATCVQLIQLIDTIPPSLTCPDPVTIECSIDSLPAYASLEDFIIAGGGASDDCALDSTSFTLISELSDGLICPETVTRTYRVADLCGNVATCIQAITVVDTTAPVFDLIPIDATIECTEAIVFVDPVASDNCGGEIDLTYTEMTGLSIYGTLSGSNEVPPNVSPATGSFSGGIDTATNMLFICVDFSGLVAPTTAAHVHIAAAGVNGPVIVPLPIQVGVTSGSFDISTILSDANEAAVLSGGTYLNIHTTTFPGGELRDQLNVPLCATTVKRIWTATDLCGNASTTCTTISVVDSTPPSITCPVDATIECDESSDPIATGTATAADNCQSDPAITYSDAITEGNCPQEFTIVRTWYANDNCGNQSSCTQTITVVDTTPPSLTCPGDAVVDCTIENLRPYPSLTLFIADGGNASDNCGLDEASFTLASEVSDGLTCPETVTRTYSVADFCGNVATCVQIITVVDTIAPELTCPENLILDCFSSTDPNSTGFATVTDNCDADPSITYSDEITAGECQVEFRIVRTWISVDDCGNISSCTQTISVEDNEAPQLTVPADVSLQCGDEPTLVATAVDLCTAAFVTYVDLQCSVTVEGFTGDYEFVNWTATEPNGGSVTTVDSTEVVLTSPEGNGCNGESTLFSIVVPEDGKLIFAWNYTTGDGPVFDPFGYNINGTFVELTNPGGSNDQSGLAAALVSAGDVFAFEAHSTDCIFGSAATTVVDFFVFTCTEEDPEDLCNYTVFRCWSATDECGNTAYGLQRIHVEDTEAPSLTCPDDLSIECTDSTSPDSTGFANATDNCDAEVAVTYSDVVAGVCPMIITRTWSATDSCANVTTCVQTITVDDTTPPSLTCPTSGDFACDGGEPFFTTLEAFLAGGGNVSDNCALDSASFTIVGATGVGPCPTVATFLYSITDLCGNLSSCVHVVTITDDLPPSITCPDDLVFECIDEVPPSLTSIEEFIVSGGNLFDNCSIDSTSFTVVELSDGLTCPETITRTYSIADFCGNVSTCVQTIVVDDTTPPVITCSADLTIECSDPVPPPVVSATDNCDTDVEILPASSITPGDCPGEFIIFRSWIAIDDCGNTSTCEQTITIVDTTPPEISCPADATVDCTAVSDGNGGGGKGGGAGLIAAVDVQAGFATATDNCTQNPFITFSDVVEDGPCANEFTVLRTWFAEDECGNVSTCVQTITIEDNTAPFLTVPDDVTIQCTDGLPVDIVTATDNCSDTVFVTYVDLQCSTTVEGFTGDYDFVNWTAVEPGGGSVTTNSNTDVTLVSADGVTGCPGGLATTFSITVPTDGKLIFSWNYTTSDGPQFDPFGYSVNGVFVPLTDASGGNSQSGLAAAIVTAGDVFAFEQRSTDCIFGTGVTTAIDFFVFTCSEEDPADICDAVIYRCWSAADACGNTAYGLQRITIEDTELPSITCPEDLTFDCLVDVVPFADLDEFIAAGGSVSDNCSIDSSSFTLVEAIAIGPCPYVFTFTYGVSDSCGNSSVCTMTIVTDDSIAPQLTCPDDVTDMCGIGGFPAASTLDEFIAQGGNAFDNCQLDTASFTLLSEVSDGETCPMTLTRTYSITDLCGNTATCAQNLFVDDTTPPVVVCPAGITVACVADLPLCPANLAAFIALGGSATDNCDSDLDFACSAGPLVGNTCGGTVTYTFTFTDDCGNTSTCTRVVTVDDNTPPTIQCPANTMVSCASAVPPANPNTTITSDNCPGIVTVIHVGDVITNQTCPNRFTLTRTYQATDLCGNTASCAQIITVNDVTPPTIVCPPNITVPGPVVTPAVTGSPTASDNCGGVPTTGFTDVIIPGECSAEYTIQRSWTATDACGNTSSACVQIITVEGLCVVDLELEKTTDICEVSAGDDVIYTITVTNDGEITVGSLTITDYIPVGLLLNDPDWTAGNEGSTGQSASIILSTGNGGLDPTGLEPGESVSVDLTLQVAPGTLGGAYTNFAEISMVLDLQGNDITDLDVDSDPDTDDTNDLPGEDDIDDVTICVTILTTIDGDNYVCPGDIVTYFLTSPYNPNNTYEWTLQNGGGIIIDVTDTTITIQWQNAPGGPFVIWLTESSGGVGCGGACVGEADLFVYIQGVEPIACNDHINISLGPDCELQLLSGLILEGEQFGDNGYFVIITDQNGNVIPDAILTGDHINQLFNVKVMSECNGQSCWGTIWVEDKLPPQITCIDVTLNCGESTEPVFIPVIEGSTSASTFPGSQIGPDAGAVTTQDIVINAPAAAQVTDINITIDLTHTWSDDLDVFLVSPNGTSVEIATDVCGANDNWGNVTFDDEAGVLVTAACVGGIPTLSGTVRPEGFLSDFDGGTATGTWTLQITDDAGGDQGILNSVSITLDYFVALPYAPSASDACGDVTLDYSDEEVGEDCENQQILRTWTATDESGNTAQCVQTITILPLTLDGLEFPENYEGSCGGSSHPNVTGWPTVNGVEIEGGYVCNIFLTWEDHPLADCGGGTKIVRTWTVLDWCTLEIEEGVQIIKLTDNEAPVLTCPADQTVSANPWFCLTDVVLTLPNAIDACGTPFTMSPSVSAGVLVHFGGSLWRVDDLPIGAHTVVWTVIDACGNSSTCTYDINVVDDVAPVPLCDEHTILTLTNDDPLDEGLTKLYATTLDDGSYDNCGPVTFLARRMDSCIDFDWIGPNGEYPNNDGGQPESLDRGLTFQEWVPFACCDVGQTIMVELRVTDLYGNINSCMVEVEVQDKLPPLIVCPPDITVSCEFWFDAHETDGFESADGLEGVFGRVLDAYDYEESDREYVIVDDPGNNQLPQPYHWGLDGWADDNCDVTIDVRTRIFDDCSGNDLPGGGPQYAVRLVERTFRAQDAQGNTSTCRQRIWVVDFDPFYITDTQCGLNNADDVRWPCDLTLTDCPAGEMTPDDLSAYAPNNRPIVNDDNCSLIGVTYEDQVFYFEDGACRKILREWIIIDWCQYDAQEQTGYWTYTQVIKILDTEPAEFADCPAGPLTFCVADENVELPSNNQVFLGEDNPNSSSCSAHIWLTQEISDMCSEQVFYDVKVYPYNGSEFVQVVARTEVSVDSNGAAELTFDTRTNSLPSNHPIRRYGLPYNDRFCSNWPLPGGSKEYHRILWSVEDGCGNLSTCEYLFRLEDCKQPTPICVGLSSVVMPSSGSVTIWAKDFDSGSSVDDCTAHEDLLFSFSGTTYQPSRVFDCDAIAANGSPSFLVEIWVADEGNDQNCNGFVQPLGIEWSERNKDFCTSFIVIDDNEGVCGDSLTGGVIETEELDAVEKVLVKMTDQNGQETNSYLTDKDGLYHFINPLFDYTIEPSRNDNHKNGVSTLDLVAIQKHLLGLQQLDSPYKLIAADANNSESVSALDLVEIRKLILGLYLEFPKNTSWRFVAANFEFVDVNQPWPFAEVIESHSGMTMQEDFVGVKVGDVNGTVAANATQIVTRGARSVLKLQIEDRQVKEGETILVPVSSSNYQDMFGYQFTMNLNGLKYAGIERGVVAMEPEFIGTHENAITMSWGDTRTTSASATETLFTIQFTATTSGTLSEMLEISSAITEAEAYTSASGETELLEVTIEFVTPITQTGLEYALFQNEPNPFADQTVIGFELPDAMPATLTLYDMSGKVIRVIDGDYAKGYNQIILKRKDLVSDGAYYYHLQAGDFTASKKMILSK